jgi:rhamnosyltransferase subunit B
MRVLLAHEFGQGSGHLVFLLNVAKHLVATSQQVLVRFVLPPIYNSQIQVLKNWDFVCPPELDHALPSQPRHSWPTFGETMAAVLLDPKLPLSRRFTCWERELGAFRPDVIVADYAPSLTMFARNRLPTVACGVGYTLPPVDTLSFPEFKPRRTERALIEDELAERMNQTIRQFNAAPLERLTQINDATATILATIPIFDPYWRTRSSEYHGVLHPGGSPEPSNESDGSIVAYLSTGGNNSAIIQGLAATGRKIHVSTRNQVWKSDGNMPDNVVVKADHFDLKRDLPGKALAVHGGTLGFASAALFAGVPQISLFTNDEHQATAIGTIKARIGTALQRSNLVAEQLTKLAIDFANDADAKKYALELAHRYSRYRGMDPTKTAAKAAIALA